jgi:hypothetical protein
MQDTLATTTVSRRLSRLLVAARRSWSRSSFRLASFSMKMSRAGMYASGW